MTKHVVLRSRIGVLIDDSKYSREDMMRIFSRGRNTISNWCTGKSYPSVKELWRLAELLGVEVGELYERKKIERSENEEKASTE